MLDIKEYIYTYYHYYLLSIEGYLAGSGGIWDPVCLLAPDLNLLGL